jgi:hypothetical protein
MKATSQAAIESVLLADGSTKLPPVAFDADRAIFRDEALTADLVPTRRVDTRMGRGASRLAAARRVRGSRAAGGTQGTSL